MEVEASAEVSSLQAHQVLCPGSNSTGCKRNAGGLEVWLPSDTRHRFTTCHKGCWKEGQLDREADFVLAERGAFWVDLTRGKIGSKYFGELE